MMKRYFTEGLVQIALLLSLMRTDLDNYLSAGIVNEQDNQIQEIIFGQTSGLTLHQNLFNGVGSPIAWHHKSVNTFDEYYTNSVFRDLRKLSQNQKSDYNNNVEITVQLVTPDTLNLPSINDNSAIPEDENNNSGTSSNAGSHDNGSQLPEEAVTQDAQLPLPDSELTKEDLDLIEVLWRQDIDLGVGREVFDINLRKELEKERELELQKQKEEQLLQESQKQKELDPYATGNWIIDSETGEYLPGPPEAENVPVVNTTDSNPNVTNGNTQNTNESFSSMEETMRILEKEAEEGMMILNGTLNIAQQQQPPQVEPAQNINIESTWQDLVSVLNLTNENAEANVTIQELAPTVDNSTENVLLQNASLPQLGTFNSINETMNRNAQANNFTSDIIAQSYNSSVPSINNTGTTLNLDTGDLFPNITNTTETNGLLQSILEDEGLDPYDLPDLDVDQDMQMMDDASSDSAVSMGGSLSPSQHSQINETASVSSNPFDGMEGATGGSDYNKQSKYQDYERYSYDQRYSTSSNDSFLNHSMSNETEYKHIVPDMKHIRHNHTYPEQPPVVVERKAPKKKPPKIKEEPLFSSRDEKKAKQMKIPLTMDQIIHSHVDEFNDLLQKHPLKDNQLQLIRDIRRRGKNKIAAQNCRKRKMDLICGLDEEVQKLREQRDQLAKAKRMVDKETIQMKEKFGHLYQEVFSSLRDENGQPYNQQDYSLQQSADGNVFLVPRNRSTNVTNEHKTKPSRKRKGHSRN